MYRNLGNLPKSLKPLATYKNAQFVQLSSLESKTKILCSLQTQAEAIEWGLSISSPHDLPEISNRPTQTQVEESKK